MTRMEIVAELGREKRVETMVCNIARRELTPDLRDLSQIVYTILLTYDAEKIIDLYEHGEINFFLARVIRTQMRSNSEWSCAMYRLSRRSVPIDNRDFIEDK